MLLLFDPLEGIQQVKYRSCDINVSIKSSKPQRSGLLSDTSQIQNASGFYSTKGLIQLLPVRTDLPKVFYKYGAYLVLIRVH